MNRGLSVGYLGGLLVVRRHLVLVAARGLRPRLIRRRLPVGLVVQCLLLELGGVVFAISYGFVSHALDVSASAGVNPNTRKSIRYQSTAEWATPPRDSQRKVLGAPMAERSPRRARSPAPATRGIGRAAWIL